MPVNVPPVVAHRGYARRYPENSRSGLSAALAAGAPYVEFDVQLTADAVPMVVHDLNLFRTTGQDRLINQTPYAEARAAEIAERQRFGDAFRGERICTLDEVVELFEQWPRAHPVVEIKRESAEAYGVDAMVEIVMKALRPLRERVVVISFVERAVLTARRLGAAEIGWCLNYYDDDARRIAVAIAPDYIICDYHRLPDPPGRPWPGAWRWICWEVTDPALALELAARGVDLIETMACGEMLADPRLAPGKLAVE